MFVGRVCNPPNFVFSNECQATSLTYRRLSQEVFYIKFAGKPAFNLQQTQLAGAGDSFSAPLDLQFVKDLPIMPFNGIQGEEKPFADLVV